MDITYNKVDQTALPISQDRVSASEYNQIAASLMHIITASGLTPDSADNAQLLTALGPRIVETYSNGTSWYRVWSDGWCEQGGQTASVVGGTIMTTTFLKEFIGTDYSIQIASVGAYTGQGEANSCVNIKTSSNFTMTSGAIATSPYSWMACGYIR